MKGISLMLAAGVLFLSGIITGYHYAHTHWMEDEPTTAAVTEQEPSKKKEQPGANEKKLSEDLLEKQERLQEKGADNLFSSIGQSFDIFHPSDSVQ
ncbi:hypothetical protein SAMN05192534_10629 [Alteribacillus persepolensis]|uniref:Uncharacterized protein n=1 Tax=Alteribacillus persepolensis TaxID=568899 RepID=A0A1G8CPH0_9BACI|nr:hypothetical protein [Alteribacillus persepolensis]SDH47159.1 hypothetical protein SAMN05192534_10629 [Alteribacillus persepolensis]